MRLAYTFRHFKTLVLLFALISSSRVEAQNFFLQTPFNRDFHNELNTALMKSTFQIVGPTKPLLCGFSGVSSGTSFVITSPLTNEVGGKQTESLFFLVTAAHVLEDISGDHAILVFRSQNAEKDWLRTEIPISIRKHGVEQWTKHPKADVAVIDLLKCAPERFAELIRSNVGRITIDQVANDSILEQIEIHPGDRLLCLGYPLNAPSSPAGFPVLRGGQLASFPILPTSKYQCFLYDFEVFSGNSGGPVYIAESARTTSKGMSTGITAAIIGLLSSSVEMEQPLKMGIVVPGSFIIETIGKSIIENEKSRNLKDGI